MNSEYPSFLVSAVIDGDTFEVVPSWVWRGQEGDRVRPTGYDAPEIGQPRALSAKRELERLVLGKTVQLGQGHRVDRGRLVVDVYVDGLALSAYFSQYR